MHNRVHTFVPLLRTSRTEAPNATPTPGKLSMRTIHSRRLAAEELSNQPSCRASISQELARRDNMLWYTSPYQLPHNELRHTALLYLYLTRTRSLVER